MRRNDPRIRQTLNQISQNIESANLTTQASLFSFSQTYLSPCLSSLNSCLEASCQPCFAALNRDDRRPHHHRQRQQQRGRESLAFDFYDDWEQDEAEWGNDELDRLLSGDGDSRTLQQQQPGKRVGMSYGTRGVTRRKGTLDDDDDVNVVPKSSIFGFLERLPWKIGGRGHRYRPSIADLQENVGRRGAEVEPLLSDEDDGGGGRRGQHTRNRSDTINSRSTTVTTNSLSSRGDLFPSSDEDDAIPIDDDEFAMMLERRNTGATMTSGDDRSSGKRSRTKKEKKEKNDKLPGSRTSIHTVSTREGGGTKEQRQRRGMSNSSRKREQVVESTTKKEEEEEHDNDKIPSMLDLKQEEELVSRAEETEVEERRYVAQQLALQRGLHEASPQTATIDATTSPQTQDLKDSNSLEPKPP